MALAACLLGYGEVGLWLRKEAARPETWVATHGNPYQQWMDDYGGVHYQGAVRVGIGEPPPIPSRCTVLMRVLTRRAQRRSKRWRRQTCRRPRGSSSGARYGSGARGWRRASGTWR